MIYQRYLHLHQDQWPQHSVHLPRSRSSRHHPCQEQHLLDNKHGSLLASSSLVENSHFCGRQVCQRMLKLLRATVHAHLEVFVALDHRYRQSSRMWGWQPSRTVVIANQTAQNRYFSNGCLHGRILQDNGCLPPTTALTDSHIWPGNKEKIFFTRHLTLRANRGDERMGWSENTLTLGLEIYLALCSEECDARNDEEKINIRCHQNREQHDVIFRWVDVLYLP